MAHKRLKILLALFWLLWTAIIIPGHTRGIVPLTGAAVFGRTTCAVSLSSGCPYCTRDVSTRSSKHDSTPRRKQADNCAICNFVAKLSAGCVFNVAPLPGKLLEVTAVPTPQFRLSAPSLRTFNSRAPPISPAC